MVVAPVSGAAPRPASSETDEWSRALLADGTGPELPQADPLADGRRQARAAFAAHGLPSRRQEAWRFTPTDPITAVLPRRIAAGRPADPSSWPAPAPRTVRLVLDGSADPLAGAPLPDGITVLSPAEWAGVPGTEAAARGGGDWPLLLNRATASGLLALRVRGAVAETLEIVSDPGSAAGVLPLRLVLLLEEGASLELLQVHRAGGASLTSVVTEVRLASGARLHHGLIAQGHPAAVLLAHAAVAQEPGSTYHLASSSRGWALSRLEPRIEQTTGRAVTRLRGLQRAAGREIADTHSRVRFGGPEGTLDQLHKAVADDASRSVFDGAVVVPREAQRTRAAQLSRNLLLSERARIDTKPQLEIVADDVTCTHGATVSRLQQEELFYLRSRGIAADQAARLLLRGFCQEVLGELPRAASPWLAAGTGEGSGR
ncbi:MAG: Fe-S cluster assembly protein SufD [Synechococcaceae cyanobacterium]|nr:Fe-S cluster assembly protein SufD [Synechococcaceae cyanobacterium]